ncbi:acetate--CoA ligase family protein [Candidatus Bipolaricaulota bacterium]|nr:acetate--CoA ligase family protein [Candidatus Bipolaricaulota bacterium]
MILLRPVWIPDELRLKRFFYALYDWSFGPTGMIGLGGTYIEVMKDGAFRAAAVDRATALETIADLRSILLSKKCLWDYDALLLTQLLRLGEELEIVSIGLDHSKPRHMYDRPTNSRNSIRELPLRCKRHTCLVKDTCAK